jgi:hypothetical protein
MDNDDELVMEVMQEDEAEAAAHLQRWNMGFAVDKGIASRTR